MTISQHCGQVYPLVHLSDIARAVVAIMNQPRIGVHDKVMNIGSNNEIYQVQDIAVKISEHIPGLEIEPCEMSSDPVPKEKACFAHLQGFLPNFRMEYTLGRGIEELYSMFQKHGLSSECLISEKYMRAPILDQRIDELEKCKDEVFV